jgi:hypothetical protein
MTRIPRALTIALPLLLARCDGGGPAPEDVSVAQMTLTTGSCPVHPGIASLLWEVSRQGGGRLLQQRISRAQIDAHCQGVTTELVALSLVAGGYESLVSALDTGGNVLNDLEASRSSFMMRPGQRVAVPARIVAARGTAFANGSWSIDNASFDDDGDAAATGCCTPESPCAGQSYLGCKVQIQKGNCTAWVSPCPY